MKTLIFNGSPRSHGDTSFLIDKLVSRLQGEVVIVKTYKSPIESCKDCRYCWRNEGCSIEDDMQSVYGSIKDCDNIVIASPLYFSELTGSLLNVLSRLQLYFSAKMFQKKQLIEKPKKGAVILCGGGGGGPERAIETANMLLKLMNADVCKMVLSLSTDNIPASSDNEAIRQIEELADIFSA